MVPPTVFTVLSALMMREPAVRLMLVEPMTPKVLAPLSIRPPAPALVMTFVAPAPVIWIGMLSEFAERPKVVMVRVPPPRSSEPPVVAAPMVGVKAKLSLVDVMLPVRVSTPLLEMVGPMLLTTTVLFVAAAFAFWDMVNWVALRMLVMIPPMLLPLLTC